VLHGQEKNRAPVRVGGHPSVQLQRVWGMRELIGATTDDPSHYSQFSIALPGFSFKEDAAAAEQAERLSP
jgi:hypothetical protein